MARVAGWHRPIHSRRGRSRGAEPSRLVHHHRGPGGRRQDDPGRGARRASPASAAMDVAPHPRAGWHVAGRTDPRGAARPDRLDRRDRPADRCPAVQRRPRQLVAEVMRPGARGGPDGRLRPLRRLDARLPGLRRGRAARASCASLEAVATGGLAAGPDDPARPAGRGRPRAQGAGRRDPVRGRVRPRLPSTGARRVPGPGRGRAGAGSPSSTRLDPPDDVAAAVDAAVDRMLRRR